MNSRIARRDFLKSAPAAVGLLASIRAPRLSATQPRDADYAIRPIGLTDVTLTDAFWRPKIDTNASVTIPFEMTKLEDGGHLSPNVLQAAIYSLQTHPDAHLQRLVDAEVARLAAGGRRTRGVMPGNDLFEVAATLYAATGARDLLDRAIADADAIEAIVKRDNPPFSGGERDAINCVALYRVTGEKRYLDLAKHYLDIRGLSNSVGRSRHNQSYKPVLEQSEAVGHAVNCASLMVSLVDVGVLTGLDDYARAGTRMWTDAVERKMYVTGGIGSTGNEGFGEPYSLPNISAYSETCAALMFITLNHKLFLASGDGKYIDVMERAMYNNAIDGVSAEGHHFFYVNRLASAGDGRDLRWEHASLECCPPNLVRFLASMPGYIYAQDRDGRLYVNLYVSSRASFAIGGQPLTLSNASEMPWSGRSSLTISARGPVDTTIKLRIPGWARNRPVPGGLYRYLNPLTKQTIIAINGRAVAATPDASGYVSLDRMWHDGDVVEIVLPMDVKRVTADDRVKEDRGRVAFERGPIVYCAEWPDCEDRNVLGLMVDPGRELDVSVDKNQYGGATMLNAVGRNVSRPGAAPTPVRLIPYYLWSNRGAGEMSVWLPTREFAAGDVGPAGGWIFFVNPNAAADGWRYLEAAPVDQSAGAAWGCFRAPVSGARGTAIGTGKQNTSDILAGCSTSGTAAALCASYSLSGVRGWFLPSRDELQLMYRNLKATGAVDFGDGGVADNFSYWASSQQTTDMASHIDFADAGRVHSDDKDFPRRVRAIRAF
jgi:uncharacterized protein